MASFGKVLDLLDDRYLELQDVIGNVEPLPTLVPYEEYTENVHVYRMDTNHEIFMGLIQDFTMRRAHEISKELWTWCVQWEVESGTPAQQPSSPKKVRLNVERANTIWTAPPTPRQAPALTIFERRTLDGALMLEEEMLRILIDIVQVASALVPNFIEFLYRWVDYYEGDGKALKAALRWEIPSLWDFEYHPIVLPTETGKEHETAIGDGTQDSGQEERGTRPRTHSQAAGLRQSSPAKKMHTRPKPDLAAIELRTCHTEESERLQYREVKYGIQPPKLEQPLPPLINIPRDHHKRTKYYAACFKSRQRALHLLLEAGVTMRQINNYQKLQTAHPKETPEAGNGNGLRNYQKDAKYAQAQFELKEKHIKQREVAISNKLAAEAQLAAQNAVPDGAAGIPLIPPTPPYAKRPDMAASMMERIAASRAKKNERINIVPKPLVGRMKSKIFENAREKSSPIPTMNCFAECHAKTSFPTDDHTSLEADVYESLNAHEESEEGNEAGEDEDMDISHDSENGDGHGGGITYVTTIPVSDPNLPRPSLPLPLSAQPPTSTSSSTTTLDNSNISIDQQTALDSYLTLTLGPLDPSTPPNVATYMQNLSSEQAAHLLPLSSPEVRQAATSRLGTSNRLKSSAMQTAVAEVVDLSTDDQLESDSEAIPGAAIAESPKEDMSVPHPQSNAVQAISSNAAEESLALLRPLHLLNAPSPHLSPAAFFSNTALDERFRTTMATLLPRASIPSSGRSNPSPVGLQEYTTAEGSRNIPVYALSPTSMGPDSLHGQPTGSAGFSAEQRVVLPCQQFASESASISSTPTRPIQSRSPTQPQPQPRPRTSQSAVRPQITHQILPTTPNTLSLCPPSSSTMLPPPRPGILRNAPSPLSLYPPKSSPFTTFAPQILATSPFINPSSNIGIPIQIYLPKILVPGNELGQSETQMRNNGYAKTDALMLGHEKASGDIVLGKAILLPVGVWENTLRKVRNGQWSVLETYACPFSHPARYKGEVRAGDAEKGKGCHRAVYEKLVQACGMMTSSPPAAREKDLTKRWRVSRGPMTAYDRGAVWEGWAAYLDREIEMNASERAGAVRSKVDEVFTRANDGGVGDGYGPYSDVEERERRKREMDELMDEDEEMED